MGVRQACQRSAIPLTVDVAKVHRQIPDMNGCEGVTGEQQLSELTVEEACAKKC